MNRIRRDDTVAVIAGKDRGKRGKVHRVLPKDGRVVVAGVNVVKRHTKAKGGTRQAGIVEREAAVHLSNVMLVCPKCDRPVRVGFHERDDGSKARFCKHCKEEIG